MDSICFHAAGLTLGSGQSLPVMARSVDELRMLLCDRREGGYTVCAVLPVQIEGEESRGRAGYPN